MFTERIKQRLAHQKAVGLFRNPPVIDERDGRFCICNNKRYLNFASNDYLGFGSSEAVKSILANNFLKTGASSSSSRLVSGNYRAIREAEKAYADFFGYEDALFFPSGYQTNLGVISGLFSSEDTICFDKHVHASCVKGIELSGAAFSGYKHNRLSHLEKKLVSHKAKSPDAPAAVITESLFSMDGDTLNVSDFDSLKNNYGFLSIVDEAHAFGVLGSKGKGLAAHCADIATGTFGKALGLFGAFVLLPSLFREYLINFSSPQIYTTTLPEAHGKTALELLPLIEQADDKRDHLRALSAQMKSTLSAMNIPVFGDAHILSVLIGDETMASNVSNYLFSKNIIAFPARFPTVPLGKAIIRVSLTALHEPEDITVFANHLNEALEETHNFCA